MTRSINLGKLSAAALLIAVGVIIPMFSPVRLVLEPASFTLASHVAIFVAMMISPGVAAAVALGTTAGFFLGGFPIVIVLRAATHLVFALVGGFYLQKRPGTLGAPLHVHGFSFLISLLHAVCEVAVVTPFYFGGGMGSGYYSKGFLWSVMLMVGVGTVVHSMVDFEISLGVVKVLQKQPSFAKLGKAGAR